MREAICPTDHFSTSLNIKYQKLSHFLRHFYNVRLNILFLTTFSASGVWDRPRLPAKDSSSPGLTESNNSIIHMADNSDLYI